jgi:hypothetical protein
MDLQRKWIEKTHNKDNIFNIKKVSMYNYRLYPSCCYFAAGFFEFYLVVPQIH